MDTIGGEHLSYSTVVPGTPAPRAGTESRVVAAGQSPTTTSNIARLASRGAPAFQPTASLLPAAYCATPDPSTCVYVPYHHVRTGERAMVPLRLDPATGIRTPVVSPPDGFHPAMVDGADKSPNFLQWLAGLVCRRASAILPPTSSSPRPAGMLCSLGGTHRYRCWLTPKRVLPTAAPSKASRCSATRATPSTQHELRIDGERDARDH